MPPRLRFVTPRFYKPGNEKETKGYGVFVILPGARRTQRKKLLFQEPCLGATGGSGEALSSFVVPPLGELTPSAERRSLSLALEPTAPRASTDLAEMVLGSCIWLRG